VKKPISKYDWFITIVAAIGIYVALRILFHPSVLYFTVLHVGTVGKIMMWWIVASIVMMVIYNMCKHTHINRTRTHGRKK